ncbi:MAG: hypothetical protein FWF31_06080 [Desulfobulbus sp.]|nr:hypothetical protein [Desulfobulbus sp.]
MDRFLASAAIVQGVEVYQVERLDQAVEFLVGRTALAPEALDPAELFARHRDRYTVGFADIEGRESAKRGPWK